MLSEIQVLTDITKDTKVLGIGSLSDVSQVDVLSGDALSHNLKIVQCTPEEYYEMVVDGTIEEGTAYIYKEKEVNAFGQKVINVAEPEDNTDGATKGYVDQKSASFITDESLSLNNAKSDLSVIKATPEKYQWYINNYTQQELSSCVFVIASDVEDMFEKRIVNVAEPTLSSDAATKNYVDSAISGFSPAGKATDDYLQLLKPFNDNKLFISISFHTSFEMNSTLFNIDMNDPTELKYFRCLLNEGASQQWVAPDYQGLGPLYDNQPVCVLVKKYAEDNDIDMSEVMCASYYWYYRDTDGAIHKSDIYSSIFPCTSEIGCGMIQGYREVVLSGITESGEEVKYTIMVK